MVSRPGFLAPSSGFGNDVRGFPCAFLYRGIVPFVLLQLLGLALLATCPALATA
jgi:hypothetical protein